MHAYASEDPVFRAMNARGQEEVAASGGEPLGDFCVDCHAPMAVREGATVDGLNLDEVPRHLQGITCYFCHNASGVGDDHFNNDLQIADDTIMRGGIRDPVDPGVHGVAYSEYHDRRKAKSSELCGSCHDIVTPAGVHLERTFAEYKRSLVSQLPEDNGFETCQSCHMVGRDGVAAVDPDTEVPRRRVFEHLWPAVDVALTDFPHREAMELAVQCELANGTGISEFVPDSDPDVPGSFLVRYETDAGHNQPSGAAQDRRLWIEFIAYDADGEILYASGDIADDELEEKPAGEYGPREDRNPRLFRDRIYDEHGEPVHMFWEAARSEQYPEGYESKALPPALPGMQIHFVEATFTVPQFASIARVTVRMRMRPMGRDVLQNLVDSGHLDESIRDAMPTFTLYGTVIEWTPEDGYAPITSGQRPPLDCNYLCLLHPDGGFCED
jgi:hypothetical protein